jgi:hypothetical protein
MLSGIGISVPDGTITSCVVTSFLPSECVMVVVVVIFCDPSGRFWMILQQNGDTDICSVDGATAFESCTSAAIIFSIILSSNDLVVVVVVLCLDDNTAASFLTEGRNLSSLLFLSLDIGCLNTQINVRLARLLTPGLSTFACILD